MWENGRVHLDTCKAGQIGGHWNAEGKLEASTEIMNIVSVGS